MKVTKLITALLITLTIGWACAPAAIPSPSSVAAPTTTPSPTTISATVTPTAPAVKSAAAPLTLEALKNAEYPSELPGGQTIKLTDGKYEEAVQAGAASRLVVSLHQVYTLGDLNGDGAEDAAVILVSNLGGSGTFLDLVAVLNEGGNPRPVAKTTLGDRVRIESLSITSGEIAVKMLTQGPQDPLCCPTQEVTRTFKLQGDKLVQSGIPAATPATISPTATH